MSIITKISGGLGNQLFQYAAGKALAVKHNVPLLLDITYYDQQNSNDTPRYYSLDKFTISASIAEKTYIDSIKYPKSKFNKILFKVVDILQFPPNCMHRCIEKGHDYNISFTRSNKNTYLIGYWQSEKYFAHYSDVIRKEFTIKNSINGYNQQIMEKICSTNSVAIHIRRGDYFSNPTINSIHGIEDYTYYYTAIKTVASQQKNPEFYIFSDEPEWVAKNFKIDYPSTIVDNNDSENVHEDLRLMSSCKHIIIANSTLSWWAAWLNAHSNKMVIAPGTWFKNKTVNTGDRYPPAWQIL